MSWKCKSFYRVTPRNGPMHIGLLSFLADMTTLLSKSLKGHTLTDWRDIRVKHPTHQLLFHTVWKSVQNVSYSDNMGDINMSFQKDIGILMDFVTRKSEQMGEIEKWFCKRHLTIFKHRGYCFHPNFDASLKKSWNYSRAGKKSEGNK